MQNLLGLFIFLFLVTIPFSVSIEPTFIFFYYLTSLFLFIFSLFFLIGSSKFLLNIEYIKIIYPYFVSVIFSIFFGFIPSIIFYNEVYNFQDINMYGRIFNIILFSFLACFISSICLSNNTNYPLINILKYYGFGCLILILSGYWHALFLYFNFGNFPFETRSHVHGLGKENYEILGRITGFAAEPSYFVPFVLDFMILSLIIFRNNLIKILFFSLSFIAIILSFSPSGYVCMIGSFLMAILFSFNIRNKNNIKLFLFLTPIFISLFIYFFDYFKNIGYVFNRVSNINEDTRFLTIYEIFNSYLQSNFFNMVFGYGITNFKFVSQSTNFDFFITSNNLLFDVLIEYGIFGFFLFLFMFFKILIKIKKSNVCKYQKFIIYSLFFDIILTGMVRADYASARFFILIAIVYLLSKINLKGKTI